MLVVIANRLARGVTKGMQLMRESEQDRHSNFVFLAAQSAPMLEKSVCRNILP